MRLTLAAYLGVSRTLSFLGMKVGASNFWCVEGQSRAAKPGDLLLLYFPRSASGSKQGIGQIYRIVSEPANRGRSECSSRGMLDVDIELLVTLPNKVTASELKADSRLSAWSALRRNFQGVTFLIDEPTWQALQQMIVDQNPAAVTSNGPTSSCSTSQVRNDRTPSR